jgi:hypothetical protein
LADLRVLNIHQLKGYYAWSMCVLSIFNRMQVQNSFPTEQWFFRYSHIRSIEEECVLEIEDALSWFEDFFTEKYDVKQIDYLDEF